MGLTPVTTPWTTFDALPPGALRRLGSRHLVAGRSAIAVTDDGTLWLPERERGLVVLRSDGQHRSIAAEVCEPEPRGIASVGDEVRLACPRQLIHASARGVTRHDVPLWLDDCAWAPDASAVACLATPPPAQRRDCDGCDDPELVLLGANGERRWETAGAFTEVHDVLLGHDGTAVVRTAEALQAFRAGRPAWSVAHDADDEAWIGLSTGGRELVSFDRSGRQWVRRSVADGKPIQRSPAQPYSVMREVTGIPGSTAVFVALSRDETDDHPGGWFRAVVEPTTGRVVKQWPGLPIEWGNGVSSNGRFAASIWGSYLLRVALDDGSSVRTADHVVPQVIAVSPAGDRVAVVGEDARDQHLQIHDVATGKELVRVGAPAWSEVAAFSPDGLRLAIAARFGELLIADAATGETACRTEEAPGAWLRWQGDRLITMYPGYNGDDCDEIGPAAVTVLDHACRVVARHEVHGLIEVIEERPTELVISAARWKHACGDNFELLPAEAWSIHARTGAKRTLPRDVVVKHEALERAAEDVERATGSDAIEQVLSADGSTRVVVEARAEGDRSITSLVCRDAKGRRTIASHVLPPTWRPPIAAAPRGEWMAVTDATSVLLYPCRAP